LVPMRAIFETFGAKVEWFSEDRSLLIEKGDKIITMVIGKSTSKVNGVSKNMDVEPVLNNGLTMIPLRVISEEMDAVVTWDGDAEIVHIAYSGSMDSVSRGNYTRDFKVVIDAGHGGNEPGASYYGESEKNLNLDITQRLLKLLTAQGIKVYMTREKDEFVGLYDRSGIANRLNADLLISIHNNAGKSSTKGTMTLYNGNNVSRGKLTTKDLAQIIQKELVSELNSKDLGIIQRDKLAVLRTARMPAIIAEIGYMSNSDEIEKLKTEEYRQKSAEAIKNAVIKALSAIRSN
jgi:N-acetylmuramoyl-L-alanine amidase